MSSLFCPRCAAPRPMNLSTSEQEITGPDEQAIKLVIHSYHCATCHSFVRSESIHEHQSDAAA